MQHITETRDTRQRGAILARGKGKEKESETEKTKRQTFMCYYYTMQSTGFGQKTELYNRTLAIDHRSLFAV